MAAFLFVTAIVLVIAGNALGAFAWSRRENASQKAWSWIINPAYLFRRNAIKPDAQWARLTALAMLGVGAAIVLYLAVGLMMAQRSGATSVCGFAF